MQAREYNANRGIGDAAGNGASQTASPGMIPAGASGVPAIPDGGSPIVPHHGGHGILGSPLVKLAGAAAVGALVTWLMMRRGRRGD